MKKFINWLLKTSSGNFHLIGLILLPIIDIGIFLQLLEPDTLSDIEGAAIIWTFIGAAALVIAHVGFIKSLVSTLNKQS